MMTVPAMPAVPAMTAMTVATMTVATMSMTSKCGHRKQKGSGDRANKRQLAEHSILPFCVPPSPVNVNIGQKFLCSFTRLQPVVDLNKGSLAASAVAVVVHAFTVAFGRSR
jgi:hypothetical protein